MNSKMILKIGLPSVIAIALAIAFLNYDASKIEIRAFNEATDLGEVQKSFKRDSYWLSVEEYNPERVAYLFKTLSPSQQNSKYHGKMKVRVVKVGNHFAGFITYYQAAPQLGKILFLSVNPEHRGKRLGERLLNEANLDLYSQGVQKIEIVTRPTNRSALKLYRRIGFKETNRDAVFVFLEKPKNP